VVSLHRRPLSNAINSDSGIEGVGMVVMGSGQRIEILAAVEVAMVFMASNGSYGDAHSRSTGNNFLFYIVLTEYSPHYLTTIFHRTI